jgi:hypothetical protein
MISKEDLKRLIDHHEKEAEFMVHQRRAFEAGEVYSLSGVQSPDHEVWLKECIVHFIRLEAEHLAIRNSFISQLKEA